jgi:hypothetical protein
MRFAGSLGFKSSLSSIASNSSALLKGYGTSMGSERGPSSTDSTDPSGLDGIKINYDWYPISTPLGKVPLGHGAVIAVNPDNGTTKYFEYGRYDSDFGQVKQHPVPNLVLDEDGNPTEQSLKNLCDFISHHYGHDTHVTGDCYPDADYRQIIDFALHRMHDKTRKPYSLVGRN